MLTFDKQFIQVHFLMWFSNYEDMTFSCKLSLFTQKIGIQTTMDMCTLRCLNTKAGSSEDARGCTRVRSGKILFGLYQTKKLSTVTRIPNEICCCSYGT